ncbi:AbgT family transporter [Oleisolibacter albus]|uniref:AbgT family transporter n=1 Tax=Oleisolibacter albus TaxID=2171757 RepID=UPI000DF3BF86|nr:AbgT family transporter [Oleisolibacter albus]
MGTEGAWGQRVLAGIERTGNRLPDPVTLFLLSILGLVGLSALLAALGVAAVHPGTGKTIAAVSLADGAQIRRLLTELPQIFAGFPPLAMVLIVMMGVGVAERSGLIAMALGSLVRAVPPRLLTLTVVFAGVQASLAADAGYVVLTPLAAVLYHSVGRHPVAGLAAAFAGVAGGFSANLLPTSLDPLLAGITQTAARLIDPAYEVPVTANYYLMVAFVPLFTLVGALVSDRIVEPRLNATAPLAPDLRPEVAAATPEQRAAERRGGRYAGWTLLAAAAAMLALVLPEGAPLWDPAATIPLTPFLHALVALLFLVFLACGIAYGIGTGAVRSDRDVVRMMGASMADMGGYIILAFAAALFIALFGWSNIGAILAIEGAALLKAVGFTGLPLMLAIILVTCTLNLLIGSASAKWAILAPVLVPLLMLLGATPEATQAAYRVGDAITNPVTPLMPYFPLILIMAQRYVPGFGIGSLVATMLPFSLWFGISSTGLFAVWFLLDLPLGPGSGVGMPAPSR